MVVGMKAEVVIVNLRKKPLQKSGASSAVFFLRRK